MTLLHQYSIALLVLAAPMTWVSCSQDASSRPAVPGTGGAPGSVAEWTQLSREEVCSPPNNAPQCLDGVFRVTRDGAYSLDGTPGQGTLSPSELESLTAAADAAASQDLGGNPVCRQDQVGIPEILGTEIKLAYNDGSEFILLQSGRPAGNQGKCIHGVEARADLVDSQLRRLMRRYFTTPGTATHPVLNSRVGAE